MNPLLIIYLVLKFAAYAGWCSVGLRRSSQSEHGSLGIATGLGLFRLLIGLGVGGFVWYATTMINIAVGHGTTGKLVAYLLVYVPVRWFEWGIISLFSFESARSLMGFLFGGKAIDRVWRLEGIVVSCVADIPMIIYLGGLPLGRFLC